jgi:hypothetical protein
MNTMNTLVAGKWKVVYTAGNESSVIDDEPRERPTGGDLMFFSNEDRRYHNRRGEMVDSAKAA